MIGKPLVDATGKSKCCDAPIRRTERELFTDDGSCRGYVTGRGCETYVVEWCACCGTIEPGAR